MQNVDLVPDLAPVILAARQIRDARNSLARFLPNTPVAAVSYRLGRRKRLDQTVPVRAIDAPATPIRRPGVLDVKGKLPAVSPIINLTEQDMTDEMVIAQQLAGLNVDWQPMVEGAAAQVALAADNTFEVMRGQLLSTGGIVLVADNGSVHEVDFDFPDDQVITLAAPWDYEDPAAVFADFQAGHEAYLDVAGSPAGVVLTTSKKRALLVNAVQKMFPTAPVGSDQLNAYLSTRDLPPIVTYDRTLRDPDTDAKTRVYPEGSMTFLPGDDDPVGRTELGITQEAVQQVTGQVLTPDQAPGLTIVTLGQDNPVQRAVKGAAIGMPVLADTDAMVIVKGLGGAA